LTLNFRMFRGGKTFRGCDHFLNLKRVQSLGNTQKLMQRTLGSIF
jgi:hypothetical protein